MKWWQFTIFVVLNTVVHDYTIPAEFVPIAAECILIAGDVDLTYDGFYDAGHMKPGKPLMPLSHYCSQPVNTRRPILYVNTGTLSSVVSHIFLFQLYS